MLNSITMKKSSVPFSDFQKEIILKYLQYCRLHFQNGSGSYLAVLDLEKILFNWCCEMTTYGISDKDLQKKSVSQKSKQPEEETSQEQQSAGIFSKATGLIDYDSTYGAWTPMFFDQIFMKPSIFQKQFRDHLCQKHPKYKELFQKIEKEVENHTLFLDQNYPFPTVMGSVKIRRLLDSLFSDQIANNTTFNTQLNDYYIMKQFSILDIDEYFDKENKIKKELKQIIFDNYGTKNGYPKCVVNDIDKYLNMIYFFDTSQSVDSLEGNYGSISPTLLLTICHQLYHKYQFSATPLNPIFYIMNQFLSLFFGYQKSCKLNWTVEGNVRNVVQTENNKKQLSQLRSVFYYIKLKSKIYFVEQILQNNPLFDNYKNQIQITIYQLKNSFNSIFTEQYPIQITDYIKQYFELQKLQNEQPQQEESSYSFQKVDIKNSYQFKFILKILKQQKILTDQFIKYLQK